MQLKILLPFKIFAALDAVTRVVVTTHAGSFGLLPHRRDCVAALSPGVLSYSTSTGGEVHLAVDEGVLIKTGAEVLVCVRHAVAGGDLGSLRKAVEQEFLNLNEQEKSVRATLAHLESGLIRRFLELRHG